MVTVFSDSRNFYGYRNNIWKSSYRYLVGGEEECRLKKRLVFYVKEQANLTMRNMSLTVQSAKAQDLCGKWK